MEYLDVVDEKNTPTGIVVERSIAHKEGLFHRHVSCWIINKKGLVLLQRRAYTKDKNPGLWAKTGGHVDAGESPEQATIRELKEEIGLDVSKENLMYASIYKSSENTCFGYEFVVVTDKEIKEFELQKEEVYEVKYFTIEEIEESFIQKNPEFTFTKWKGTELLDKMEMLREIRKRLQIL